MKTVACEVTRIGLEALSDGELVALFLRSRSRAQARRVADALLMQLGGLAGLRRMSPAALEQGGALSSDEAVRIAACIELGLRCLEQRAPKRFMVRCSNDVVRVIGPRLTSLCHEQLWVVGLDGRNKLLGYRRISEGGQHGCAVLPRDVLRAAINLGASSFILVHNHPAGDVTPSRQDVELTEGVSEAAACIGLPLVDHVIVSAEGSASLLDLGLMAGPEQRRGNAAANAPCGSL